MIYMCKEQRLGGQIPEKFPLFAPLIIVIVVVTKAIGLFKMLFMIYKYIYMTVRVDRKYIEFCHVIFDPQR